MKFEDLDVWKRAARLSANIYKEVGSCQLSGCRKKYLTTDNCTLTTSYEMYTYDESGNRLTKTTQDGTINYEYDGDNRLQRAENTIYFYDNSGNLIKKMSANKTINYTYDYENRLVQYSDGTNVVLFEYDGEGNRMSKTVNGVKTKYINDLLSPITQVLLETTVLNNVTNRYAYGYSRINQINQGTASFYLYDNPGRSVTALVNGSQSVINNYEYDSFGNIKTANETTGNSFKYVGEQYDEETGLIYLRHRYYDPEIGRFISKDPFPGYVTEPQTKNPYPYTANNPVNWVDPSGQWINVAAGAVFGAVGAFTYSVVNQYLSPGPIEWDVVRRDTFGGMAMGAAAAATMGIGTAAAFVTGASAGMLSGSFWNVFVEDPYNAIHYPWESCSGW